MVAHFLDAPAIANTELEAAARYHIETGDLFRQPDRVALGDERDAGAEADLLRHRGARRERDELIVATPVHFR